MLVARKGLPGHQVYDRVRNALEILEKLGLSPNKNKRVERLKSIRNNVDTPAHIKDLLYIGYELDDILHAGFDQQEFKDEGIGEMYRDVGLGDDHIFMNSQHQRLVKGAVGMFKSAKSSKGTVTGNKVRRPRFGPWPLASGLWLCADTNRG